MGTRSTISLHHLNNTVSSIYCHWDGYLDNNGKILLEHYKDLVKVKKLICLGNISSLSKEIGIKHPFDKANDPKYKDMCNAFGRDRGEKEQEPKFFKTMEEFLSSDIFQEYDYIFETSTSNWFVKFHGMETFIPLTEAKEN